MRLAGKTAVVTGAASGIGAATARLLKREGARVIAMDRAKIEDDFDKVIEVDLSSMESIDAAVAQIDEGIDALCNIAGVSMVPPQHVVITVNFLAPRYLTEKLIARLNDGASVVNMASVGGMAWREAIDTVRACLALKSFDEAEQFCLEHKVERLFSYKLAKEALIVWTMQTAASGEHGHIRFNCVSPGVVETPLWHEAATLSGERGKAFLAKTPHVFDPADIADAVLFLCEDRSARINGADIAVDAGLGAILNRENFGF